MRILLFLAEITIDLQDSARHQYVEVVLHGKAEGKFLEDPEAHRDEMMGQISRLGRYLRCVTKRETDDYPYRTL